MLVPAVSKRNAQAECRIVVRFVGLLGLSGPFTYVCMLHPNMNGTIGVE